MMQCASKLCATNEKECYQGEVRAKQSYLAWTFSARRLATRFSERPPACDGAFWCAGAIAMDAHG